MTLARARSSSRRFWRRRYQTSPPIPPAPTAPMPTIHGHALLPPPDSGAADPASDPFEPFEPSPPQALVFALGPDCTDSAKPLSRELMSCFLISEMWADSALLAWSFAYPS